MIRYSMSALEARILSRKGSMPTSSPGGMLRSPTTKSIWLETARPTTSAFWLSRGSSALSKPVTANHATTIWPSSSTMTASSTSRPRIPRVRAIPPRGSA